MGVMGTQEKEGEVELLSAMPRFLGHCQLQWGSKCRGRHGGEAGVNGGPRAALRHISEGDQLVLNPGGRRDEVRCMRCWIRG